MDILILIILPIFMLGLVFSVTESKGRATVVTCLTVFGILAFVLLLETNLNLIVDILDSVFDFVGKTFVTIISGLVFTIQVTIVAFFEGFIWLFMLIGDAVGWLFVNSLWCYGQAPITITIAFCILCVWGASRK
jgi:hypothetical protein